MARINIEDSLWSDHRFMKLCISLGNEREAVGSVVLGWKMAQKYWCPDRKPIPKEEFKNSGLSAQLIACGLAKETDDGIRMSGSEENFSWWFQRQDAGRLGGLASARKRQAIAKRDSTVAKRPGSEIKQIEPSSSSSSSSSSSKELNTIAHPSDDRVTELDLENFYQGYPRKLGKANGLKTARKQIKTKQDLKNITTALDNYLTYLKRENKDVEFYMHFSTFMNQWKDWLDPNHGKTTSLRKEPVRMQIIGSVD